MKKKIVYLLVFILLVVAASGLIYYKKNVALPTPEISEGIRGDFGIDKNLNESTIDNYLHRKDVVYRDVRLIKDPVNFEVIGGDSYLSGFVDGFEVIPFPYIAPVVGLPDGVGEPYDGPCLFNRNDDGTFTANYEESMQILEDLFPKDKTIFIMCGGGGYAGMMKDMLISLGWDANKLYNVGGFWYYEGKNTVQVKNDKGTYDTWKIPYHNIDFSLLTEKK